jgi:hypothetical protein
MQKTGRISTLLASSTDVACLSVSRATSTNLSA